jgi:hypothetical protein
MIVASTVMPTMAANIKMVDMGKPQQDEPGFRIIPTVTANC